LRKRADLAIHGQFSMDPLDAATCQSIFSGVKKNEKLAASKQDKIYLIILKNINAQGGNRKLRLNFCEENIR
jgi:hypothetical protein